MAPVPFTDVHLSLILQGRNKGISQFNKRLKGSQYESLAADYLRSQGYTVIGQNYYTRFGEIDLLALAPARESQMGISDGRHDSGERSDRGERHDNIVRHENEIPGFSNPDSEILVFCEVKYRSSKAYGDPLESITKTKIRHMISSAMQYMKDNRIPMNRPCRFDVIGIEADGTLRHIKNAIDTF